MSDTANHPAAIRPTTAAAPAPTCIVTVVPAHDERELLPRCLRALQRAAQRSPVPVHTTVVLDDCTDDTALVVPAGITAVELNLRNVGAARAAGFAASGLVGRRDVWFSTTDADSVVPDSWFVDQLTYWADHDAMAGTVRVDWAEHDGETRRRYDDGYRRRGSVHGHVHGANLGVRADVYHAVGGFRPLATGEDVDLVTRLGRAGHRVAWDEHTVVTTSDRRDPRAPRGFGDHLLSIAAGSGSAAPTRRGPVGPALSVEQR